MPYYKLQLSLLMCTYLYTACSLGAMKDLVAESAIMKTFHHPNVLPLLGVCIDYNDQDMLKIIMPFMANGDLKTFLKDSRITPNNTQEYPKVCNTYLIATWPARMVPSWHIKVTVFLLHIDHHYTLRNAEYAFATSRKQNSP